MKRILIADSDHDELVITKSVILSIDEFEVAGDTTSYSLLPSLIDRHNPQFVLIAMRYRIDEIISAVQAIRATSHPCQIIVMGDQPEAGDIVQCFRAGADEFICTPLDVDELQSVVESLDQKPKAQAIPEPESKGKVTALCGCRGGSGTTTIAVNLTEELSRQAPVVLVDFHFGQGDLGIFLNVTPKVTLSDIQQTSEQLDDALLESATHKYSEHLQLLLQSTETLSQPWNENEIRKLLRILCQQYDHVVIDCGTDVNLLNGLQGQVQRCVLVMKQDMSSLTLAKAKQDQLLQSEYEENQINVLVNSYTKKNVITTQRISKVVNRNQIETIREDEKTAQSALNRGVVLREVSTWSRALRDIHKMAEHITGKSSPKNIKPEEAKQDEIELKPLASYKHSAELAV